MENIKIGTHVSVCLDYPRRPSGHTGNIIGGTMIQRLQNDSAHFVYIVELDEGFHDPKGGWITLLVVDCENIFVI